MILGGDLNMHPQDLGNRLLRTSTGLRDSYSEAAEFDVGSRVRCKWNIVTLFKENRGDGDQASSEKVLQICTQGHLNQKCHRQSGEIWSFPWISTVGLTSAATLALNKQEFYIHWQNKQSINYNSSLTTCGKHSLNGRVLK